MTNLRTVFLISDVLDYYLLFQTTTEVDFFVKRNNYFY